MVSGRKKNSLRPLAVKVGYLTFSVFYLTEDEWKKAKNLDESSCGQTTGHSASIWVRIHDDQEETVTKEILLHEILHAIFYVTSLSTTSPQKNTWEELVVQTVSPSLMALLNDNPELAAYLTGA